MAIELSLSTGMTLAVEHHGDESAPPLILLHGLSGRRQTWDPVVEQLLARYVDNGQLQLLAVDQRGHGDSSRAGSVDGYDALSYAADLAAVIEFLGAGPAAVVGHSLGGVVAATLAATRPELLLGVLLEDPPLYEGDTARREASPVAQFFPRLVAAVRDLQARDAPVEDYRPVASAMTPPDEVDDRCQTLRAWDPTTMEAAIQGVVWRGYDPSVPLRCPVTVVRADPEVGAVFEPGDAEAFLAANPDAEVTMVAGAGHSVHAPATLSPFMRELNDFLVNL